MKKIGFGIIAAVFFCGTFFGYILGLWQQIAQKQHRQTCQACREYANEERAQIIREIHDNEHFSRVAE